MSAKSKLTPEVVKSICRNIRIGCYADDCARAAGVHPDTYTLWLQRGKKEESGIYRDLYDAVEKAKGEAGTSGLGLINDAAEAGDWKAKAFILERTQPAKYGARLTISQEAKDRAVEQVLRILSDRLDPEVYANVVEALHSACDEDEDAASGEAQNTGKH